MTKTATRALLIGAVGLVAVASYAAAEPSQRQQVQQTPKGWSYNLENGQRVPKGNRLTNSDGSWREELRQGDCVTVKEKSAAGEYKESRQCDHH
ncbi:MAG TPA: hypothetical protein VHS33_06350 [Sphingomicrobium sp.]|jgi:hypothetical protein|nr:hypothetical protein [Sphingomicrobium sp.]